MERVTGDAEALSHHGTVRIHGGTAQRAAPAPDAHCRGRWLTQGRVHSRHGVARSLSMTEEAQVARADDMPRVYRVLRADRAPLLRFMLDALRADGCTILNHSGADQAPFRIAFETASGERMGIVAYAFFAGSNAGTPGRPNDEHSFQVKYGSKDGKLHKVWTDPYGLYTTLFCGIDPKRRLFVGADPRMHNPTRFFIRIEYKQRHVNAIRRDGWHTWERERLQKAALEPAEVFVGGTSDSFLRYVRFERDAQGLDQGHRQLLAEKMPQIIAPPAAQGVAEQAAGVPARVRHRLADELMLSEKAVLDLIAQHRRLKMAVRGWVAEKHLVDALAKVPGVSECRSLDEEGGPDVSLRFRGSKPLVLECKNVLRQPYADGTPRVDFQKTRAAKGNHASRFYSPDQFDVVAACLHAITERWEFRYILPTHLAEHKAYPGKLSPVVRVDAAWAKNPAAVLAAAAAA